MAVDEGEIAMHKADVEDMELGNLIFGHSRGTYQVAPRMEYQRMFYDFLERNGFDSYGYYERGTERVYENDTFVIRPYYWGEDDDEAVLPNFEYKPMGLEIRWYKYPMRDAYSNMDISTTEFGRILRACEASMEAKEE